ncbi:hypothetical protein JYG23_06105 [Sedimentibacter sp. zth1]|uniref:hypothetical protein n=1 Tax=Sedimentibacter sp. zth1 TaxID=2816908 RepID=UPI001A91FF52|nr:hypothetical protein [Sedimentibacter sp. zth1]QSX06959.1 hypothetical protein JYG23_06105 [Sedimentibacter sp. zth1]
MKNNPYYNQIMEMPGLDDIKKLLKQFHKVSTNLKKIPDDMVIVLPDLLWDTRSGAGKTHLLKLLSEYLNSVRLIDFYGDVKYFEFLLDYCEPRTELMELTRLIREVNTKAGFRCEYGGLLALDISAWKNHYKEIYFNRIMEYLSSIDDRVCIIFIAENFTEDELKEAEYILSTFFRIRRVKLDYPSSNDLTKYIIDKLSKYGLEFTEDAVNTIKESVEELKAFKYFDGYKTINRMCQDIVFEICMSEKFKDEKINATKISRYSKDGEYVQSMKEIITIKRIGFGGHK